MNRRISLCWLAVLILALCVIPSIGRGADDADPPNPLLGKDAPDFTLKAIDGKDVKLSKHKGDVVVIDFWAIWCPPCRKSLPHLSKLANNKELVEKGLQVYALNCGDDKDKVEKYVTENNLRVRVLVDTTIATQKDFMLEGVPATVIVGRDGKIKNVLLGFEGEKSEKLLEEAIATALKDPK